MFNVQNIDSQLCDASSSTGRPIYKNCEVFNVVLKFNFYSINR